MAYKAITLESALAQLPDWRAAEGRCAIVRSFRFKDFRSAFAFMTEAAEAADRLDHHPEWSNIYNRVEVLLTTHATGGITDRDVALAKAMDEALRAAPPA